MKKILFVIGSLREKSFNRQLANAVKAELEDKAEVAELDFTDVPFLNQDIENPAPESVARIRQEVLGADGIWFFSPEYNGNLPGYVKNTIDWLSRPSDPADRKSPSVLVGKKATSSGCAGKSGSRNVQSKLQELLTVLRCEVMAGDTVAIPLGADAWVSDELTLSDEDKAAIAKQVKDFLAFL